MKLLRTIQERFKNRGQSLVEFSLFLPILLFLLVGLVEIGNLLNTKNRVVTASRMGAGYGAANFDPDAWDPVAEFMGDAAINTITQTMPLDLSLWDIWSVRALTNGDGTDFVAGADGFEANWVYGDHQVVTQTEWDSGIEADVKADMLAALQSACDLVDGKYPCAANLEVVASVPFYNMDTIIGVEFWQWAGLRRVNGLTVMRVDEKPEFAGCPILPITIRRQQYSIYPTNWPGGKKGKFGNPDYFDGFFDDFVFADPVTPFPTGFEHPRGPEPYYELVEGADVLTDTLEIVDERYPRNVPGVPLDQAQFGYLYMAREYPITTIDDPDTELSPIGNFGWLAWQDGPGFRDANTLGDALTPPGTFMHPEEGYPGGNLDMDNAPHENPSDSYPCEGKQAGPVFCGNSNGVLEQRDWIAGIDGNKRSSTIRNAMKGYVDTQTPVFLVVYDTTNNERYPDEGPFKGDNLLYRVYDFAKVRVVGYEFRGNEKWILYEFIEWGRKCESSG